MLQLLLLLTLSPTMKIVIRSWSVESCHWIFWVCQNPSPIATAGRQSLSHLRFSNLLRMFVLLQTLNSCRTPKAKVSEKCVLPSNAWVTWKKVWTMPPYWKLRLILVSLIPLLWIVCTLHHSFSVPILDSYVSYQYSTLTCFVKTENFFICSLLYSHKPKQTCGSCLVYIIQ